MRSSQLHSKRWMHRSARQRAQQHGAKARAQCTNKAGWGWIMRTARSALFDVVAQGLRGWGTAAGPRRRQSCTAPERHCMPAPSRGRRGQQSLRQGGGLRWSDHPCQWRQQAAFAHVNTTLFWDQPPHVIFTCLCLQSGRRRHSTIPRPRCTPSGRRRNQQTQPAGRRGHLRRGGGRSR